MAESIGLLTIEQEFGKRRKLLGKRVVGILCPSSAIIREHGMKLTGMEQKLELTLPSETVSRIVEFYTEFMGRARSRFYNCHSFVRHITPDGPLIFVSSPVEDGLKPGTVYRIMSEYDCVHSMIGINDPHMNLSVLGARAPLVIADNRQMMDIYGGMELMGALTCQPDEVE